MHDARTKIAAPILPSCLLHRQDLLALLREALSPHIDSGEVTALLCASRLWKNYTARRFRPCDRVSLMLVFS